MDPEVENAMRLVEKAIESHADLVEGGQFRTRRFNQSDIDRGRALDRAQAEELRMAWEVIKRKVTP